MKKFIISSLIALVLGITGVMSFSQPTHAANAADFDPGYIIDDYVFYNSGAMDSSQIQNFLNSKNPNCDYWGTQSASDWGYPNLTHAQFTEKLRSGEIRISGVDGSKFHAPPYRCLTMYTQNTPQMEGASGYCGPMSAGSRTAAQIINDVAKACGINPQVLIVLLEKEQSLVTDKWPLNRQLQNATGFACPDTAPCDPAYEGLFYQIYYAARQFKVYQAHPNSYNYRAGRTNNIYWNPDLSRCGSSQVYIQNQATAGLYVYTPYRPNQAALNNLYGTGDSCSSYGNRNFWRMFTDWFGSTKLTFTNFDAPRYMQIKNTTKRYNVQFGQEQGDVITPGTQAFFVDKIFVNGQWYARTEYAKSVNELYGIPVKDLQEVPSVPITEKWISIPQDIKKTDPLQRKSYETISGKSATQVTNSITVDGKKYYQTKWEHSQGSPLYIPESGVEDFRFYDFLSARPMIASKNTSKIDTQTKATISSIEKDTILLFSKRLTVDGVLYAQVRDDTGTLRAIKAEDLTELGDPSRYFVSLENPRYMRIKNTTHRVSLTTGQSFGDAIDPQTQAFFVDKFFAFGQWYARTIYAKETNEIYGIPVKDIEDIPVMSITPQWISIPANVARIDPLKNKTSEVIEGLSSTQVVDSITVNGVLYYKTRWENSVGGPWFIPASSTQPFQFYDFSKPRTMTTTKNTSRINVQTKVTISSLPKNSTLYFNKKLTVDGKLYAQLQSDNSTAYAILADDLK